MNIYLGKQKNNAASTDITPTHGSVLELVHKVEGVGHKIYMDNSLLQNYSAIFIVGR
jgi:hypothetical protein